MRFRKTSLCFVFCGLICFGWILLMLGKYKSLPGDGDQGDIEDLERKVKNLERDLKRNYEIVEKIGKSVADLLKDSAGEKDPGTRAAKPPQALGKLDGVTTDGDCSFLENAPLKPDIQMLDVYSQHKFDNPDGGVWKQGWDVQFDENKFSDQNRLRVFVVPHSHNDAGWIKTFQRYYEDQTRHILNNLVRKVSEETTRKFIWAEISYLDIWWKESDQETRAKFKELVMRGQVEIVTGGWVMNDEANTHYFGIIEQLKTGHEWLKEKLNISPQSGWANDPFGYSSSMPYLLKLSGVENMVIHRVHYAIKKVMAKEKNLEFRWRQNWDRDGKTDMLCHMMPFYSYDVPHTCGPDPKICCQFDFRRLKAQPNQTPISCPWKIQPVPITDANVHKKAATLLDQYRKKSSLYKTNVLMVQLGDDFRYDSAIEYDQQFINYQKLFDYMNSRSDWMVEAQFGTLKDYFDALRANVAQSIDYFPSLSGDFFTYADIDDHYWSGYFTTRPFYKQLNRVLEGYLRSAEIIYSMTWSHLHRMATIPERLNNWMSRMMALLSEARRDLGLFQHHDGITGTAKDHVVQDYARMMQRAIQNSQGVIEQCAHFLLGPDQANYVPSLETLHFLVDNDFAKANELPKKRLVRLTKSKRVVFYNSLASERIQTVTLRISHYNVQVTNERSEPVQVQLSPVFVTPHQLSNDEFDISFIVTISPLGMSTYIIRKFDGSIEENSNLQVSEIVVKDSLPVDSVVPFTVAFKNQLEPFTLENNYLKASFDSSGLLAKVTRDDVELKVSVGFVSYGTRSRNNNQMMSGAYVFLPDGPGQLLLPTPDHHVRIIKGPIFSQVVVYMPYVVHQVTLHQSPGVDGVGLDIDNLVNIAGQNNLEVAMRLVTNVKNGNAFYSDLNGLQMTRRQKWDQLPLQAQFYPMPTMAYIEDSVKRLTLATRQPLGVASLESGYLEVMLDRRLNQDDNRGLGQGVLDNVIPTLNSFRLLVESRIPQCKGSHGRSDGYPSLSAHRALHGLLYPVHHLVWNELLENREFHSSFRPALAESGADIHLVNLRTGARLPDDEAVQPSNAISMVIHRLGFDCCFVASGLNSSTRGGEFSVDRLFPDYFGNQVRSTSLTSLHQGKVIEKSFTIGLKPMELYTFELQP